MTRARNILVVALMVGLAWSAVTMAAGPIALNTFIETDETGRPDWIKLSWQPVNGAANYRASWGPAKQPGTWFSANMGVKTKINILVTPGEGTRVMVVAYDNDGDEITRSETDVIKLPKGKRLGGGQLQTHGAFRMSYPGGTDQQDSRGQVWFQVYENPSLGAGKFEIYGLGKVEFREVTVFKGGSSRGKGSAPLFVTGVLRYPTDEEEEESDDCRMDLKITEAFKGRVLQVSGSIYGIRLPNILFDNSPVMRAKGFPVIKGLAVLLSDDGGWDTYTVKLADIDIEAVTGCSPK